MVRYVGQLLWQLVIIVMMIEVSLRFVYFFIPEESKGYFEEFSVILLIISSETVRGFYAIGNTLCTIFIAVAVSLVISFFVGAVAYFNKYVNSWVITPIGEFFRAIPVTILVPIASLVLNRGDVSTVVILASIPAVAIMTYHTTVAIGDVNELKVRCYKLNTSPTKWDIFKYYLMIGLPSWFSGFKIIFSYSFVVVCVLEMLGMGPDGSAGKLLINYANQSAAGISNESLAIIFWLGIVAFLCNKVINNLDVYLKNRSFHQ